MRTAPAGLAFPPGKAFQEGAACAAITHGHPSGYLPAGLLSEIIAHMIEGKSLEESLDLGLRTLIRYRGHEETSKAVEQARKLVMTTQSVEESIEILGEGWVGEEALAIAIYCALKFPVNWEKGTLAAVNHSGDSDSTGSIAGALLGTLMGVASIPRKWVEGVEDSEKIQKIADDMFMVFKEGGKLSFEV